MKNQLPSITPNRFLLQPSTERFNHIYDFVPYKARYDHEIERRKRLPPGSLVLEAQARGLEIMTAGLRQMQTVEEVQEWADCVAIAGIGTSPYLLGGNVMHRYIPLPMLAAHTPEARPSSEELWEATVHRLQKAHLMAEYLTTAHRMRLSPSKENALALKTGKMIAQASLSLAAIPLGNITADPGNYLGNKEVQMMVRQTAMRTVQQAGSVALEIGAFPSAAQLAEPLSPLGVEIQKAASNTVATTYLRTFT